MNYDTMTVHELVKKAYQVGCDDWPALALEFKELPSIESALRKACIREASVGTMTKTMRQKGSVEWNTPSKRFHEGVYDLIPKETT